jgi:hypothetical protein
MDAIGGPDRRSQIHKDRDIATHPQYPDDSFDAPMVDTLPSD